MLMAFHFLSQCDHSDRSGMRKKTRQAASRRVPKNPVMKEELCPVSSKNFSEQDGVEVSES
jgi:hypothetical protein